MGVIGPLLIKGDHVLNEHILCPFATTEGALVASSTRGATAMTRYLTVNDNDNNNNNNNNNDNDNTLYLKRVAQNSYRN